MTIYGFFSVLLLLLTSLPLLPAKHWWVRGLEFPRLQLFLLSLSLTVIGLVLLDLSRFIAWVFIVINCLCSLYQAWWIYPYTFFGRKEVGDSSHAAPADSLRFLTVNVLMTNRGCGKLCEIIDSCAPDAVLAVETDQWWRRHLDEHLDKSYPYSLKCPLDNLYGMLFYSRLPLRDADIRYLVEPDIPSIHGRLVLRSGQEIKLHCLHPRPPVPPENERSSERDAELIIVGKNACKERLPVLVAGDLNDVAWSATTRLFLKISGLRDPRKGRGMFNTYNARIPVLRWPLDHFFHSSRFKLVDIKLLEDIGSDHFPILIELEVDGTGREEEQPDRSLDSPPGPEESLMEPVDESKLD